jgi:hypothetical protein
VARQFDDQVEVIGVPSRDRVEAIEDFVATYDLGHVRQAVDLDAEVWARFDIPGQPAWAFVDGDTGEIERVFGALELDEMRVRLEALTE